MLSPTVIKQSNPLNLLSSVRILDVSLITDISNPCYPNGKPYL